MWLCETLLHYFSTKYWFQQTTSRKFWINCKFLNNGSMNTLSRPFLISFLLPSWRAVRYCRPHLEERGLIRGDDWSHSTFIRRSPSWGFLGFSLGCKANARRSVHSPPLIISDRRDWHNTRGKWPLARNPDRSCWHRHTSVKSFFGRSLWLHERKITLIISDRRDWRDTRDKYPLTRNPDRSWWHRHTN